MTKETPELTAARIEAERARARMMDSAHLLQARLKPTTLAQNAWDGAKIKGADLAEEAVDAVRKRPLAATGILAAIGVFLAREPLMDLASRLVGRNGTDEDPDWDPDSEHWSRGSETETA